ncbi:hypothetical protein QBC40DRAFT_301261 [Triangularia verruculosa]|uniref:Uncharacterized protein n=1 Tax=Triangularia verruculosa TaxID=2587418 RepID=A0AAN7AQF5_9PEZI|nr:hypothetical protein QBC40DRAFT_301261 [Triangularia verruculosa]
MFGICCRTGIQLGRRWILTDEEEDSCAGIRSATQMNEEEGRHQTLDDFRSARTALKPPPPQSRYHQSPFPLFLFTVFTGRAFTFSTLSTSLPFLREEFYPLDSVGLLFTVFLREEFYPLDSFDLFTVSTGRALTLSTLSTPSLPFLREEFYPLDSVDLFTVLREEINPSPRLLRPFLDFSDLSTPSTSLPFLRKDYTSTTGKRPGQPASAASAASKRPRQSISSAGERPSQSAGSAGKSAKPSSKRLQRTECALVDGFDPLRFIGGKSLGLSSNIRCRLVNSPARLGTWRPFVAIQFYIPVRGEDPGIETHAIIALKFYVGEFTAYVAPASSSPSPLPPMTDRRPVENPSLISLQMHDNCSAFWSGLEQPLPVSDAARDRAKVLAQADVHTVAAGNNQGGKIEGSPELEPPVVKSESPPPAGSIAGQGGAGGSGGDFWGWEEGECTD